MQTPCGSSVIGIEADAKIIADCLSPCMRVPPDVAQRVQEHADEARKQLVATQGVQEIGVQIIRDYAVHCQSERHRA